MAGGWNNANPWYGPLPVRKGTAETQERPGLGREQAMGTELSVDLALAIHNGLDISSLPALQDLSTGASTMVRIPLPLAGMEQATPEWWQRASDAMASSWAAERVKGTATGTARSNKDWSAASIPRT